MSQTTNAVIAELMDRRLLNDVDDDLHQEIADAVIKAARLSRPDTAEARLREALERVIEASECALGDHVSPHDCYATGPSTGDPIADLVVCPGCVLKREIRQAI